MNQNERKMTRGVKAIVIAAIIDIVVICLSIFLTIWGTAMTGELDAMKMGVLTGRGIGMLVFPAATLVLAAGRHRIAMLVTLILSFTGGCIHILSGTAALIVYFTAPNRKQYFEPYQVGFEVQTPGAEQQPGAEHKTEGGEG